jgi:LysR family hydrogen peroxide-inducible transcriptional activator
MSHAALPFSLRQLQYAVAVADTLSFRRAAALCHVSQPSLSAQLALLEHALGARLFERDRRRVLITRAGQELVERARQVLRDAEDLREAGRRAGEPLAGTLRLGVIPTISPYLLPRVTPALRRRHPDLTILWIEERTATLARRLKEGALDGAVVALESEIGDVDHAVIAEDRFLLAAPAGNPLIAGRTPLRVSDLRGADVLLLEDGHCLREQALALCRRGRAREREFRATSLPTLAQMVAGGAGVTLLPELAVAVEATRARLRVRPFAAPPPRRTIALVWRRRSPMGEAMRELAAVLRKVYPRRAGRSGVRGGAGEA